MSVPRPRPVRLTCGLAAVAAVVAADGLDREPADATLAPVLRHPERLDDATRDTLRLATWNIHRGRPLNGPEDLAATLADLRAVAPDLAALQEVGGSPDGVDQAAELADGLGTASLFVGTERRWWHEHLGNALLTNVPLGEVHRVPLPGTQGKKYRQATLTSVNLGGRTVRVLSVHLDHRVDRERQLAAVLDLFLSLRAPAVLLGDLNTWRDRDPLAAPLARGDLTDAVDLPRDGDAGVDHILTRGLEVVDAGMRHSHASDHALWWADLRVAGTGRDDR